MSDLSNIYKPSNIVKEVISGNIQIQDSYGNIRNTLDYRDFASAIPNGRFVTITKNDDTSFRLQFTTSDNAISGMNNITTVVSQLKNGTYVPPTQTITTISEDLDYSVVYHSTNFIKEVKGDLIQIQDRLATEVKYSLDYKLVTTTLVNNRFLVIYRTNLPKLSLQFLTNEDANSAHTKFRNTMDQLKDNTYNYQNTDLTTLYDPDTFIATIAYDDYSVQVRTKNGKTTNTIVATQVVKVYVNEVNVIIRSESNMNNLSLRFETNTKAISGAEKLRLAIKKIVDRIPTPEIPAIKSFSDTFDNVSTWKLDPPIDFPMGSALEYYEYVCPTGGSCSESDLVKQSCKGLVEYVGDEDNDILYYILIKFNKNVSGKATVLAK
jgi:hypothetical protein